jgi:hypothetical protein
MLMLRFNIIYLLPVIISFTIFLSCQRGLSPYPLPVSKGALLKDSSGNCSDVIVSGTYNKDQQLNDSNSIEVNVNITSPGSYTITTDTVNGYSFSATGTVLTTGLTHIKLKSAGAPVIAGEDHFTIKYDTSFCEADVLITEPVHEASFTFEGAPDICANDRVYGNYITRVALDSNSYVIINLNVTEAGSFTILTDTINGYYFSGSGKFLSTGLQTVLLYAWGTPVQKGTDVFTVKGDNSACNFSVNVLAVANVLGDDYFPLTANSYWTYDDLVNSDTIIKTIVDSTFINNYNYKIIREDVAFGGPYDFYYRKSGTTYFEYAAPNEYTTFFQYKKPVEADIPLLEENLQTGSTWQSPGYIDTTTDGSTITLRYDFSCLDNDATVALNNQAFAHVYKIQMLPEIKTNNDAYSYTTEEYVLYYAKGIGLIYLKKNLGSFTQQELQIRNWKVY